MQKRASSLYHDLPYNPELITRAKALRKAGNLSEALLWVEIKNEKLNGLDFDRQKIIDNYIVDFYCAEAGVIIEIDGESHDMKGEYDEIRDNYFNNLGLTIIHIPDKDVRNNLDGVMQYLRNHPVLRD